MMGCQSDVNLGENLTFSICTHDPDTGVLTDADANPAYRVYENETAAAILTGTMAKLDDGNTTGFYTELLACTTANGFENNKSYTIYIAATVDGDTGGIAYGFRVAATPTIAISAAAAASVASGTLALTTYYTLSQAITSTTTSALDTATKVWLAVKENDTDTDAQSIIFLEAAAGLTYLAGAAYATPAHGTLVVAGSSGAWVITVTIQEAATALLYDYGGSIQHAELKALVAGDTVAVWTGVCEITQGLVKAIA